MLQLQELMQTCSKPPSNSVVSVSLFIGRIFRGAPVSLASSSTSEVLPVHELPTYTKIIF